MDQEYTLTATIPTVQYGNLQPSITLRGKTLAPLEAKAMKHIQKIWDEYGTSPLKKNTGVQTEDSFEFDEVLTFTGEKVLYNDYLHEYRDLSGGKLISGSTYAASKSAPFPRDILVPKTAAAWGVSPEDLGALWDMNGRMATEYGSMVHTALEIYHRYGELGAIAQSVKDLEYNYCLPKQPYIRDIVLAFIEQFGIAPGAQVEVFVSDVKNKMVGQIDILNVLDMEKKVCRLGDYKTNFEMKKPKLKTYQIQMSYYAQALINKGWTVEGLDLYHWNGEVWVLHELDILPIELAK